ncbi:nuclear transport factor 2 family protein, partial [Acinetobacter baumannii]|nr:nuclear transport factor 2 family protein [Acinetobacter baumannii]
MSNAINTLIEQWKQAVVAKDVEQIVSFYAEDIVAFDAVNALQFKGKAAYRAHWQACMEFCPGP